MAEEDVLDRLRRLEIETPSWGYGNSGTRFHVYPRPGAARTVKERIADFKVPQYVAIRTEPLPRNPGGKVLKAQLRDETDWGEPLR